MYIALCVLVFAGFALAQTYTEGGGFAIYGVDKLGAHQNGGKGCVGCHTPHSGAWGNGGNPLGGAPADPTTGDIALWGQDMYPLYGTTLSTGGGDFDITLPGSAEADEAVTTGVMMCLSCHDGNIAKGAMMTNQAYEQTAGLLPPGTYGPHAIPTLLGNDGTAAGNYKNDHPIGPAACLGGSTSAVCKGVGVASRLELKAAATATCQLHGVNVDCLVPKSGDVAFMAFYNHYGAFNITQRVDALSFYSGGRTTGVVIPAGATSPDAAYVVCTTCHTPHSMYTFSGSVRNNPDVDPVKAGNQNGVYPTYFFVVAPYNPNAPIPDGTKASSATQFCRQCHFTGAGGSNEGSGIMTVDTQF